MEITCLLNEKSWGRLTKKDYCRVTQQARAEVIKTGYCDSPCLEQRKSSNWLLICSDISTGLIFYRLRDQSLMATVML